MNNDRLNMGANNPYIQGTSLYYSELERLKQEAEEHRTTVLEFLKVVAKPLLKYACVAYRSLAALRIAPPEEMSTPLNIIFFSEIVGLNIVHGVMQVFECEERVMNYHSHTDRLRANAIIKRNNITDAMLLQ